MAGSWSGTTHIDRPIEQVFTFLADGENDPKFSPRVLEIEKTSEGPLGVGATYVSRVKDGGLKSDREFKLTRFDPPTSIRWTELSENSITVPDGGYDLVRDADGTKLTISNELEGHGVGRLLAPLALRATRKGADAFARRIKGAVEAS